MYVSNATNFQEFINYTDPMLRFFLEATDPTLRCRVPTFNKEGITKVGSVQDKGEGLEPGRNYDNNNTLTKRIF